MKRVMDSHTEFYHVGRALYEAADHFGKIMQRNQTVYHGLDRKMTFRSFTEYFNAPTSTTTAISVGMPSIYVMNGSIL